jgi:hypothetical protein
MVVLPGAIIFMNDNVPDQVRDTLRKQLFITGLLTGTEFDGYVSVNPDYPTYVRNHSERIMVMRPFTELDNRTLADVVIYVDRGMISVETNKYGPRGLTLRVAELYWGKLSIW